MFSRFQWSASCIDPIAPSVLMSVKSIPAASGGF